MTKDHEEWTCPVCEQVVNLLHERFDLHKDKGLACVMGGLSIYSHDAKEFLSDFLQAAGDDYLPVTVGVYGVSWRQSFLRAIDILNDDTPEDDDDDAPMPTVHRMVDFDVSVKGYGDTVCGVEGEPSAIMPSGYNCPACRAEAPGLQRLGMLETVLMGIDTMPVGADVKALLWQVSVSLKTGLVRKES